jgi:hemerythrin-like domain-containing protein
MSQPPIDTASPIDDFSQTHADIVGQLRALAELPALLEPAARARRIADDAQRFFREVILAHHADEERELFPAVLGSAAAGDERERVQAIVQGLTAQHRELESAWSRLQPRLAAVAKGRDAALDAAEVAGLVDAYLAHARFEEASFLPLAQTILARDGHRLAALGLSLHLRHALPEVLHRFAGRL